MWIRVECISLEMTVSPFKCLAVIPNFLDGVSHYVIFRVLLDVFIMLVFILLKNLRAKSEQNYHRMVINIQIDSVVKVVIVVLGLAGRVKTMDTRMNNTRKGVRAGSSVFSKTMIAKRQKTNCRKRLIIHTPTLSQSENIRLLY